MRRVSSGVLAAVCGAIATCGTGCLSYSSYQDARIVEKGSSQATMAVSVSSYGYDTFEGPAREYWFPVELGFRAPVASRVDGGFKLAYLMFNGGDSIDALVEVEGDLRVGVLRDRLALALPVSAVLGSFSSFQFKPGVVVTVPLLDDLDLNSAAAVHLFTSEDPFSDVYRSWQFNVGLGWRVSPRWTLRPEVGWLVYSNNGPVYNEFGLGLTVNPPRLPESNSAPLAR